MDTSEQTPVEQDAVTTTIVGGRPPGSGQKVGPIPRGIEVLVKKAAVDPQFRSLLLETRGHAAGEIGLDLAPAEAAMLGTVPRAHLEKIIAETRVGPELRPAFLGKAAAIMLAALGTQLVQCDCRVVSTAGVRMDRPDPQQQLQPATPAPSQNAPVASLGVRP